MRGHGRAAPRTRVPGPSRPSAPFIVGKLRHRPRRVKSGGLSYTDVRFWHFSGHFLVALEWPLSGVKRTSTSAVEFHRLHVGASPEQAAPLCLPDGGCRCASHRLCVSALCHVWTAPSWQELSSRLQHWSVQPCVRPHMMVSPSSAELGRPRSKAGLSSLQAFPANLTSGGS